LKTWVHRILVNTAKNRGVREKRTVPWSDLDAGPTLDPGRFQGADGEYPGHWRQFPQAWPSPESAVLAGEVQRVIGAALAELPVLNLRGQHRQQGRAADAVRRVGRGGRRGGVAGRPLPAPG